MKRIISLFLSLIFTFFINPAFAYQDVTVFNNTSKSIRVDVEYDQRQSHIFAKWYSVLVSNFSSPWGDGNKFMDPSARDSGSQDKTSNSKGQTPRKKYAETTITVHVEGSSHGKCEIKTDWKQETTKYCDIHIGKDIYTAEVVFAGGNGSLRYVTITGGPK